MKHLGDITKINGAEIPIVDCITGGSPCQDLSVAGKRAGLSGERSGLFMEQLRIVKEMRKRDQEENGRTNQFIRPRFMVWENVPGAFSSNNGKDFQAVLTEIVRIVEPDAPDVPMPDKGKWTKSGCIYDEMGRWSIAWRVHDAQFWGVPQRRKRIALVADFGGLSAPEVLFERKGVSGDFESSGTAREETAGTVGSGVESAISFQERAGKPGGGKGILIQNERVGALSTLNNQSVLQSASGFPLGFRPENVRLYDETATTICNGTRPGFTCGVVQNAEPIVLQNNQNNASIDHKGVCFTLPAAMGMGGGYVPMVTEPTVYENHSQDSRYKELGDICQTVSATYGMGGNNQPIVVSDILPFDTTQVTSDKNWSNPHYGDPCHPLAAQAHVPSIASPSLVRRLTPIECERLQGFPDGWTDIGEWTDTKGKRHQTADSARYKALGNSIALPFWFYLLRRISAQYERPATLGSLFDGIGGFPLCWERCNGEGTAIWASEIEEFPIAVTKRHFPERGDAE